MKKTILLLSITFICIKTSSAQKKHQDSIEVINAASRNAMHFRLSEESLKKFQKEHFPRTSDYFKPNLKHTPAALYSDSLFVKMYRLYAFDATLGQKEMTVERRLFAPLYQRTDRPAVYTDPVQQTAQRDAIKFVSGNSLYMRFQREHWVSTSDYFKPSAANASNPALLNDSLYIQTFRYEAYFKLHNRRQLP